MAEKSLKSKVLSGFGWTFGERILAQGVSFVISIVLARLLTPDEYGVVALLLVFINIANVFVANGFGEALIQKKNVNDNDFSTLFWCSFAISLVLYAILFFSAPFIADFYDNEQVTVILRVFALRIPLSSINTIQHAYVSKRMEFKKFFFSTLGGTILSGVVGILMAYKGFGAWALIGQYMTNSIVDTLVLLVTVNWRPKLVFVKESAADLMHFGWRIITSNLINNIYANIRSLIIGKVYTTADLSYYNKGDQFPSIIINNVNTAISKVIFPAMSDSQYDLEKLKKLTRRSMQVTAYITFPFMIGMIVIAKPLVQFLLTEKWIDCVPFLQICCVFWLFQPMQTANWQAIKALGRADLCVRLEVIKKIIGITLLVASINISVYALVLSNAVFGGISMIINMIPNRKLLNYPIVEQIKDILPPFGLSCMMGIVVSIVGRTLELPSIIMLIIEVAVGVILYLILSIVFKIETFYYLKNIIITFRRK